MPDATVKGGYWGDLAATYSFISGDNPLKRRIAALFNRASLKALREVALTLDGVAPGQTALETHARVLARESTQGEVGGRRTIETVTDVNRVTVAGDVTEINADILSYPIAPSTYATNRDGNPRGYPGG
jgi:hypothetical protein